MNYYIIGVITRHTVAYLRKRANHILLAERKANTRV